MLLPKVVPAGTSYVKIPATKRAAMRILLETVQRGSRYWTGGEIAPGKALNFAQKMAQRYRADATQAQRAYAKSKGVANTALVMFAEDPKSIRYWLLATPGSGAVHEQEQLRDTHERRGALTWGDQYQLEHVQRPRAHGGGRSWTWKLTQTRFDLLEASMRRYAAAPGRAGERTDDLDALVAAILRMPGFYGVRHQQMELLRIGREVWERSHRDHSYPWPQTVPYIDKGFACYHRPDPLCLDVLVRLLSRDY